MGSLFWSSIGLGFVVYGKRQSALMPLIGGILLMAISYLVSSVFWMSLASALVIAGTIWFRDRF